MTSKAPALVQGSHFPNQPISAPSLAGKGLGDGLIDLPPNPLPARKGEFIGEVRKMAGEAPALVYGSSLPNQPFSSPSLAGKGELIGEVRKMVGEAPALVYGSSLPNQPFSSPTLAGKGLGDGLIDLPPSPLPRRKGEFIGRVMEMMSEMRTTVRTVGARQPMDVAVIWPSSPFSSPSLTGKGLGDRS